MTKDELISRVRQTASPYFSMVRLEKFIKEIPDGDVKNHQVFLQIRSESSEANVIFEVFLLFENRLVKLSLDNKEIGRSILRVSDIVAALLTQGENETRLALITSAGQGLKAEITASQFETRESLRLFANSIFNTVITV